MLQKEVKFFFVKDLNIIFEADGMIIPTSITESHAWV